MASPTLSPSDHGREPLHFHRTGLRARLAAALTASILVGAAPGCEANRSVSSAAPSPGTVEVGSAATSAASEPSTAPAEARASGTAPTAPRRVLVHACSSDRELGEKVLDALRRKDAKALDDLRVTETEYKAYLFPEFPAAAPNRTIPVDFHWGYLNVRSLHGIEDAIQKYGGRSFELLDVIPTRGIDPYKTFRLLGKVELDVRDLKTDEILRIKVFGSVVELDGQYKILSFPT